MKIDFIWPCPNTVCGAQRGVYFCEILHLPSSCLPLRPSTMWSTFGQNVIQSSIFCGFYSTQKCFYLHLTAGTTAFEKTSANSDQSPDSTLRTLLHFFNHFWLFWFIIHCWLLFCVLESKSLRKFLLDLYFNAFPREDQSDQVWKRTNQVDLMIKVVEKISGRQ